MFHSTNHQAVIMAASACATDLFRFTLSLIHFYLTGFAPIFPDTCYHLTHYWPAAADIPVA
ncbi:hypothetical protein, partial [Escherichia coli]